MNYQVSARKWRPMSFPDVIGQSHVVQTLVHAVEGKRVAHAYLFSGMRGVGKTTVARILAKAMNCHQGPTPTPCAECQSCVEIANGQSFDVMEIDGASNNSVEDVRSIRETIKIGPAKGTYRLYIIDEVHMLSTAAFNALLKTLEEPPAHVIFIFATTEVHKIPQTILSRCQHFSFRRVPVRTITEHLQHIVTQEAITISPHGLETTAKAADGSLRDALSLLDQIVAFAGKTVADHHVDTVLGNIPNELRREMLHAVVARDPARALEVVWAVGDQGGDLHRFLGDLVEDVRSLVVLKISPKSLERLGLSEVLNREEEEAVTALTVDDLQRVFEILTQTQDHLKHTEFPSYVLEMAAIKVCQLVTLKTTESESHTGVTKGVKDTKTTSQTRAPQTATREQAPRVSKPVAAPRPKAQVSADPKSARSEGSSEAAIPKGKEVTHKAPLSIDWAELVERVGVKKPNLASYLVRGVPIKVEHGIVMIAFSDNSDRCRELMARDDNQKYVQDVCRTLCGTAVELKFVRLAKSSEPVKTIGELSQERHEEQAQNLRDRTLTHPSVRMVLDEFGGQLQEVCEDRVQEGEPQ
ncbi:MAG TPA: DNA polymerase III subunit gamma/tau [Nitrospirales bacterium]|nr:DNA polymerase III subunit gamma/tau [Nitrospirales bacterium]